MSFLAKCRNSESSEPLKLLTLKNPTSMVLRYKRPGGFPYQGTSLLGLVFALIRIEIFNGKRGHGLRDVSSGIYVPAES